MGNKEYENLVTAARIMTELSPNGYHYRVKRVIKYISDYSSWDTIVAHNGDEMRYQALLPLEHKAIVTAENEHELTLVVERIMSDPYWPDK